MEAHAAQLIVFHSFCQNNFMLDSPLFLLSFLKCSKSLSLTFSLTYEWFLHLALGMSEEHLEKWDGNRWKSYMNLGAVIQSPLPINLLRHQFEFRSLTNVSYDNIITNLGVTKLTFSSVTKATTEPIVLFPPINP